MKQDHPTVVHRESDGYSVCVPSLGILVSALTLDECYDKVEELKKTFFESIVERGFGDSMLSVRRSQSNPRPWVRMVFMLSALTLILLTVLIPTTYLLSAIKDSIPASVEAAMHVVQRRMHEMSDLDQQRLSKLATSMCPVVDEMVAARCKRVP